ncbi:MAG: hypothetical protein EB015_12595 [Methylocystaceae bacterium]|nr:hypothetical protein [Methylocystaceae bacterium]
MIVGNYFAGDENYDLKIVQHDIYYRAIGLMITSCNNIAEYAAKPDYVLSSEDWGKIDKCDHRTIQFAHDLLAAAYRYKCSVSFETMLSVKIDKPKDHWITWSSIEVQSWWKTPNLLQNFLIIMACQNEPYGYLAETRLCLGLLDRFPDVPWEPDLKEAFEKDLARYSGLIGASSTIH